MLFVQPRLRRHCVELDPTMRPVDAVLYRLPLSGVPRPILDLVNSDMTLLGSC